MSFVAVATSVLALVALTVTCAQKPEEAGLGQLTAMQQETRLYIPERTAVKPGAFYTVAILHMTPKDTAGFIDKNHLTQYVGDGLPKNMAAFFQPFASDNPQAGAELYELKGQSATNRWEVIVDRGSGRVWLLVRYPDEQGHYVDPE